MFGIKKDLERKRIEITISGDEILMMLPEGIADLMNNELDTEKDGELKKELDIFEKGAHVAYVPLDKIKIEGF
jgi:hypothetical protein